MCVSLDPIAMGFRHISRDVKLAAIFLDFGLRLEPTFFMSVALVRVMVYVISFGGSGTANSTI